MNEELIEEIRKSLESKPTAELRQECERKNLDIWSPEALEAMRRVLSEREEETVTEYDSSPMKDVADDGTTYITGSGRFLAYVGGGVLGLLFGVILGCCPRFGLPRRRFSEMKTEAVSQLSRRLRDFNRETLIQVRW
jgi:hypothetical protein